MLAASSEFVQQIISSLLGILSEKSPVSAPMADQYWILAFVGRTSLNLIDVFGILS